MDRLRRVFVEQHIGMVMVFAFLYGALRSAGRVLQYPFDDLVIGFYNAHRQPDTLTLPLNETPISSTLTGLFGPLISILLAIAACYLLQSASRREDANGSALREDS